jgi:hypothetical protein
MGAPSGTEITVVFNEEAVEDASEEELDAVALFLAKLWEEHNYGS